MNKHQWFVYLKVGSPTGDVAQNIIPWTVESCCCGRETERDQLRSPGRCSRSWSSVHLLQDSWEIQANRELLPGWKISAISSFALGAYTKIFMPFDEPFWDNARHLTYANPETRGYYPEFQPLDCRHDGHPGPLRRRYRGG